MSKSPVSFSLLCTAWSGVGWDGVNWSQHVVESRGRNSWNIEQGTKQCPLRARKTDFGEQNGNGPYKALFQSRGAL